jgi:nitrogen regulatory protein P-II 1
MVKVQAIIREERLDAVVERLLLLRVRGLTITPVRGAGESGTHRAFFRGGSYDVPFVSKVQLEWYGSDNDADGIVRAIVRAGATGAHGDGNVFVEPIDEAIRIRTGERGSDAI